MTDWPTLRVYVDWDRLDSASHDFTADARADMSGKVGEPLALTRGRSLDFTGDAKGQATFRIPVGKVNGSFARQMFATPGLVGYWPLGESAGPYALDSAGVKVGTYVPAGALGAAGPLVGDTATAVTLNGTTQYVTIPDSADLDLADGPLTLAAWVKRSSTGTEDAIIGKGAGAYYLYIGSDDKVYLAKQGTANVAGTTVTIADTAWHHVVATYAGSTTGKVYIDAVDRTTATASSAFTDTASALGIGSQSGASAAAPFAGSLAHAAIWDRALTAAEVSAVYAAGTTMPVFPAYDKIGRGDVMLGCRVLILADYLTDTNRPLFSGRITRIETDPQTYDLVVTCADDFETLSTNIPMWLPFEGTFRELRMDAVRRMQTGATYTQNMAYLNPNGGASRSYWDSVPVNRVANPGFEASTTGWNITANGPELTSAAVSILRTAGGQSGSWRAAVAVNTTAYSQSGAWTDLSAHTFKKDVTYRISAWFRAPVGRTVTAAIYSNGSPADYAGYAKTGSPTTWTNLTVNWTPTADRSDAHLAMGFTHGGAGGAATMDIDSLAVWVVDSKEGAWWDLTYADPLCLSSTARESVVTRVEGTGPYGLGTYLNATAASGASMAFLWWSPGAWNGGTPADGGFPVQWGGQGLAFLDGLRYTATAWLKGSGTGRIRIGKQGIPASSASSSTAALTGSWQRFTVSWTAPAGANHCDVALVAETTGATVDVGGVTVVQGTTAWDWCPTVGLDGLDTTEDGMRVCRVTPSGKPIDVLKALNAVSFANHWCEPLAVYPWWRYRTRCIPSLATKTVAETYDDDVSGYTGAKQTYDSLINVVHYTTGTTYFDGSGSFQTAVAKTEGEVTDAASTAVYGEIATDIGSDYLEPGSTALATIPAYILDRYAVQRQRFSFVVENRWPSQLLRDLDDLVVLSLPRIGLVNGHFIVVGIAHDISATGRRWRTTYQVEAAPPP